MDSWEWNKIAGAVLGTLMFVLVLKFVAEAVFEVPPPAKPGYVVEGVQEDKTASSTAAAPAAEALPDFGSVLPTANVAAGKEISAALRAMPRPHQGRTQQDRSQSVGRGRPRARDASGLRLFQRHVERITIRGPYDKLFVYLKSPQGMVPGTKMTFRGPAQRAGSHQPARLSAHTERQPAADSTAGEEITRRNTAV